MKGRILAAALAALLLLSGCETLGGLGRDMKKAGEWMEKTARDNQ